MIFDKTQAMRNAERHLVQGKIKDAIGEYKQVVERDAKDFSTLNMLGDLYSKNSQKSEAVKCYASVAEHYSYQGFAQKAIAIYKKIVKLEPEAIEISEKLAELYKSKGSLNEAKSHYTTLADHYQKNGQVIEALSIWKEIALLDPNNVTVYLTIAESYLKENQIDEAADAFAQSGLRLSKAGNHAAALQSFSKALELKQDVSKILAGFVEAMFAQGKADEAAERLNEILVTQPNNRDIRFLLVDCLIESGNTADAEKAVIKLVEQEPSSYPKLLHLANIFIRNNDLDSATRVLTMASEHTLVDGHAEDFHAILLQILYAKPEQIDALRLMTRYCSWQRDDAALLDSLTKLYAAAKIADSIEDERYALNQLVMVLPHEVEYSARLKEINAGYGFDNAEGAENLFKKQILGNGFAFNTDQAAFTEAEAEEIPDYSFEPTAYKAEEGEPGFAANGSQPGISGLEVAGQIFEQFAIDSETHPGVPVSTETFGEMDAADFGFTAPDEDRLKKEVESIEFYIENGYADLAEKAITDLHTEFGDRTEIEGLKAHLSAFDTKIEAAVITEPPVPGIEPQSFDMVDLRNELGFEDEGNLIDDSDYETHYHTAVAYQEMGLTEEAIKEFQKAIALVNPNDGTRRFFSCSNLLGHCFMQKGMPNLALTWFQRTLETPGLSDDEKQGLWYELAGAYEADGDTENAGKFFEQVYAENINFRDVSERVRAMAVPH
ncbi:MAG: tetratricopeptide repeat protein [Pyrinomonadaceae bacterium]